MSIKSFDSIDELFDEMEKSRIKADASVHPFQAAIKKGDFFMRYFPDASIVIFGEVLDPFSWYDEEIAQAKTAEERAELEYELAHEKQMRSALKHMRFTRAFSTMCVEGEMGDTHVATMIPIPRAVFETAKRLEWQTSNIPNVPENLGYIQALNALFSACGN